MENKITKEQFSTYIEYINENKETENKTNNKEIINYFEQYYNKNYSE